ncbi:urease subunit beta [Alkalihalobacillus sp. BA299]|uniref:urease subunit beta n=1 Tax=Alkalihalobacillus sp. BA299 TaxID=2815938 RepID=UPI001FFE0A5C|nr:urease subunit beta [Alkalihalobacillus sp. BA299]
MIPGEIRLGSGFISCNRDRNTIKMRVANTGDRPIQVGSHFHFAEVNRYLTFERIKAIGMRLNIASGTAVRFEPGEEKDIELVEIAGKKIVHGLNSLTNGHTSEVTDIEKRMKDKGFIGVNNNET